MKLLKRLVVIAGAVFVSVSFSGAFISDAVSVSGNKIDVGSSINHDVKLNEVAANPVVESGSMPLGEWVELYNSGNWHIDVNGWGLYDESNNSFQITASNTHNAQTVIAPRDYLVIYKNGSAIFNNGGDTARLLNRQMDLIESFSYTSSTEGKSWARIPDGFGVWSGGHIPTPGAENE